MTASRRASAGAGDDRSGSRRYVPPDGLRLVFLVVLGLWLVFPVLVRANPAQDALPYVVAGEVARTDPSLVYATRSGDLYDLEPAFAERTCELSPAGAGCADAVAFVSTPLAVPFAIAVGALGGDAGVLVIRFIAAASLAGGMWALWNRLAHRTRDAGRTLVITAVALTPFATVPIALGQTSPLLFLSAAIGVTAATRPLRSALTAALWVATIALKAYPAALVLVLLWQRRWTIVRDAVLAGLVLVVLTVATTPTEVWRDFTRSSGELSGTTVTNPFNGSVDALVHHLSGWSGGGATGVVVLVVRLVAAGLLVWWAARRLDDDAQWAFVSLLLLLVIPLVWWHYLWVAVAAVGLALAGRRSLTDRTLLVLPALALATVPISIPYGSGSAVPVAQSAFLLASIAAVVLLRRSDAAVRTGTGAPAAGPAEGVEPLAPDGS